MSTVQLSQGPPGWILGGLFGPKSCIFRTEGCGISRKTIPSPVSSSSKAFVVVFPMSSSRVFKWRWSGSRLLVLSQGVVKTDWKGFPWVVST